MWDDCEDDSDACVERVEDLLKTLQLSDVSVLKINQPGHNIFFPLTDAPTSEQDRVWPASPGQYLHELTSEEYPHEFASARELLLNVTSLVFMA